MLEVLDNFDLYDQYEAEQVRHHKVLEAMAREEEIMDRKIDEMMYEKWEEERC